MKQFLQKHWEKLLIAAVTLLLFIVIFLPFILYNSLDKFDTPGLLSLSWFIREYRFPDFQGWNPYFAAGFPQGVLYPPLFHYLVALIGKIVSLELSYKLIVTTAGLLIPSSVYFFNKQFYKQKPFAMLSTFCILITLLVLPGYLGFNFDGLIDYGLGPSFFSIPLFFIFLGLLFHKDKKIKWMILVFSITVLSHLLTALILAVVTLLYFALQFEKDKCVVRDFIKIFGFSFLITSFWTVPFLAYTKFSVTGYAMKIPMFIPLGTIVIAVFILGLLLYIKKSTIKILGFLTTAIIIAIIGLLDTLINSPTTRFAIPLIHPFRIQIYGLILAGACFVKAIQYSHQYFLKYAAKFNLMKLFPRILHITINLTVFVLIVLLLSYYRLEPKGVEEVMIKSDLVWSGRSARIYKISEVLDQSRAVIDKSVMKYEDGFAVDGLLKESSYLAPYFQSLEKNINPDNYDWKALDQYYIENKKMPQDKVHFLSDILWLKNVYTISKNIPSLDNCQQLSHFKTQTTKGPVIRYVDLCAFAPSRDSSFVEIIRTQPDVVSKNWNQVLEHWWTSHDKALFVNKPINVNTHINGSKIDYEISDDFQEIKIVSNSISSLPVIVKMSYFPKWKAFDKEGNEIDVVRISPNLMVVDVSEETTLKYKRSSIELFGVILTILGLPLLLIPSKFILACKKALIRRAS